eukprot:6617110-Alexandrium_andersonii.AAC.1
MQIPRIACSCTWDRAMTCPGKAAAARAASRAFCRFQLWAFSRPAGQHGAALSKCASPCQTSFHRRA